MEVDKHHVGSGSYTKLNTGYGKNLAGQLDDLGRLYVAYMGEEGKSPVPPADQAEVEEILSNIGFQVCFPRTFVDE